MEHTRQMMANARFIGWGQATRGREQVALQVFGEALESFEGLQQQGEIRAFEPVSLEPHGGDLSSFVPLHGDPERLSRMRASEEFRRLIQRADLVGEDVGVVTASMGDELTRQFASFQQRASWRDRNSCAQGLRCRLDVSARSCFLR
jgi:hypothetical protein